MKSGKIAFVVGLTAEARLLRGFGFAVGVGGGTPVGALAAANALLDEGATALVSFGLAGGLRPALAAGHVLVPDAVVAAGVAYPCDAELARWLGGGGGLLLAGAAIAVTVAEKAAVFAATGADAVDLESGAVAQAAAARGKKFGVLRAVADPAGRALPPAALIALNSAGTIGLGAVLRSVLRQPTQIPALVALAGDAARARAALLRRLRALA